MFVEPNVGVFWFCHEFWHAFCSSYEKPVSNRNQLCSLLPAAGVGSTFAKLWPGGLCGSTNDEAAHDFWQNAHRLESHCGARLAWTVGTVGPV